MNVGRDTSPETAVGEVRAWIGANVPRVWIDAGRRGGAAAVREVRTRAEYEAWYPVFAASGLVVPTWPVAYGGLDLVPEVARAVDVFADGQSLFENGNSLCQNVKLRNNLLQRGREFRRNR